jgi:hypothetical protein
MRLHTFTRKTPATRLCIFITLLSCVALAGCRRGDRTPTQATAPPSQPSQQGAPSPVASLSPHAATPATTPPASAPPQPPEVQDALARVYQNAVTADAGRGMNALTGDFNGDGSEDIAVVVKPDAAHLSELNGETANWIVEDPRRVLSAQEIRPGTQLPPSPPPVKVEAGDTLLAIIHGYTSKGWRNADAKQTYLLKNAVGDEMRAQSVEAARTGNTERRPLPFLRGDLIWQKLSGRSGCIYWTGAKYGWYDSAQTTTPSNVKNSPHAPRNNGR